MHAPLTAAKPQASTTSLTAVTARRTAVDAHDIPATAAESEVENAEAADTDNEMLS